MYTCFGHCNGHPKHLKLTFSFLINLVQGVKEILHSLGFLQVVVLCDPVEETFMQIFHPMASQDLRVMFTLHVWVKRDREKVSNCHFSFL